MQIKDYIYLSAIAFLAALCLTLGWFVHSYKTDYENELKLNANLVQGVKIASDEALKDANKTEKIVERIVKVYEPQKQNVKEFKADANESKENAANRLIGNFIF